MTLAHRDRLTRMIERLSTQRTCLDYCASAVAPLSGCVLEIGLGKGRTYDRLRCLMPERDVHAFDHLVHCPDDVRPPQTHLWVGDFRTTLDEASLSLGATAIMVHADIGSDDRASDALLATAIGPLISALLAPGAMICSDRPLALENCVAVPLPAAAIGWPYFMQRRAST